MDPWLRSSFTQKDANNLVWRRLLRPVVTNAAQQEWRLPDNEDHLDPLAVDVVSFAHFHKQGFRILASKFFRGLLHHYGIEL
jgi:hypothetical protein